MGDHPLLSGKAFGLMSGDRPLFHATAQGGHEGLHAELTRRQIPFQVVQGKYGEPERSFLLPGISEEALKDLGERYGQESVIHSMGGQNRLLFTNGPKRGQSQHGHGHEVFDQPPEDFYTEWPGKGFFRLNLEGGTPHPNAYSWHDGHTAHHQSAEPDPVKKAQWEKLPPDAAGFPTPQGPANHPTTDVGRGPQNMSVGEGMVLDRSMKKAALQNEQFAPAGVSSYGEFAKHYGGIGKPGSANLKFYDYAGKGQAVNDLLHQHGYTSYYAGGKYGAPDLANKNYNTKHLMIYDPDPGTGGDFGEREYTDSWRKVHELAHALTYPEINRMYGEGRRIGKLGYHRTPNEALRAVHWEHLAAHKQRELSAKLGIHINDQDFNKEYNTVMHDAAHRAVTGKFTDPNKEGFQPHNQHVPLSTSLALVQGHAAKMGLYPHETLKTKVQPQPIAKTEAIYPYVRGQVSMADANNEKLYTPEEARDILLKATREKIDGFAREIETLRKRELAKGAIAVHAHKPASSASGGVEDVPAADIAAKAEGLCKDCGKVHKAEGCSVMAKGSGPTHVCSYPACGKGIKGDKDFCSAHSGKPVKKDEPNQAPAYKTTEPAAPEGEKSSSDEHQDMLEKVTPPGISEKTMHKLKAQYPGDKEAAYATAWKIHNKVKKALAKAEEFVDNQGHMVENGIDPDAVLPPKAPGKQRTRGVSQPAAGKNGQKLRDEVSNGSGGAVLPGASLKAKGKEAGQKGKDTSGQPERSEGSVAPGSVTKPAGAPEGANDKTYSKRGEGKDAPGSVNNKGAGPRANTDKVYGPGNAGKGANDKTYESVTKAMPSVPTAKPPKMGTAAPASAGTGPGMQKGLKDKVAAAALMAGTALTAGAIPAQAHHAQQRVESRIKLPGSNLKPHAAPVASAAPGLGKGGPDTWAGEGIPERSEASTAPKKKFTMDDLKAAKAKLVQPPKPAAAKKAEDNDALHTDAPSKKDSGENSALTTAAPDKVPASNKGLDVMKPAKGTDKDVDPLHDAPPSKKDSGKNDALASDAASKKDSGENSALEDAAPVAKGWKDKVAAGMLAVGTAATAGAMKPHVDATKAKVQHQIKAPKAPEVKAPGSMEKGWKDKVAAGALAVGTAMTGGAGINAAQQAHHAGQPAVSAPAHVGTAPLPSQRPQLSARPGPLANKTPAAPAPKKPGIFGKLQGK